MLHKILLSVIASLFALTAFADGNTKEKAKTIYFFGVAKNYTDSVACLTDVCKIDSVAISPSTKDVANLDMYTDQYRNYFLQNGQEGYICATFVADSYKKIEKLFLKQRMRLERKGGLKLSFISNLDFQYQFVDSKQIYRNEIDEDAEGRLEE